MAERLHGEIPGLKFRIVGDGPERKRLHAIWHEKRLEDTVHWLDDLTQDELAREYNRCDLFCLPSIQEGFGLVFLEAMAAGKPILAARAGAAPEVVEQGLLVEPESELALAGTIHRLYCEPALRSALAAAGKRLVTRYNAPEVARRFLAEVSKLL